MSAAEAERLHDLLELADPDRAPGPDVDELVARASELAGVPMATVNLLDADRQCQVATTGFAGSVTPRREAMCNVALELGEFVHVPDAREDPRFRSSPWVDGRQGSVRFYASAPLRSRRGYVIGTLCVFDIEPNELRPDQVRGLEQLADEVVAAFERERRSQQD